MPTIRARKRPNRDRRSRPRASARRAPAWPPESRTRICAKSLHERPQRASRRAFPTALSARLVERPTWPVCRAFLLTEASYTAKDITVLEGLEPVRLRPGMYIGSTGSRGLHHLVYEVVDNSVDEALAGRNDRLEVILHPDNSVTVKDQGSGIPVDVMPEQGLPALTVVLTKLHAGGKFGGDGYKVSGGLHGVGVSVVNALSEWLRVESSRDGFVWAQEYSRGKPTTRVSKVGPAGHRRGTLTRFRADTEMFETTDFSFDTISQRLRESAYLNKGVWIKLVDERDDRERSFYFEGGVVSFVRHLNRNKEPLHNRPIYVERRDGHTTIEVAFQYNDSYAENI